MHVTKTKGALLLIMAAVAIFTFLATMLATEAGVFRANAGNSGYELYVKDLSTGQMHSLASTNTVAPPPETPVPPVVTNHPPVFVEGDSTTRELAENSGSGVAVGNPVAASDPNTGDVLAYRWSGADAQSFNVDGATGQIRTVSSATYDYETKSSYQLIVTVADGNGGSDSINVTVNLVDNVAPDFGLHNHRTDIDVPHGAGADQNVGAPVVASDPGDTITYSMTDTSSEGVSLTDTGKERGVDAFNLNSATGQFTTKTGVTYDHSVQSTYALRLIATDTEGDTGDILVYFNILDPNRKPVFRGGNADRTYTIPENAAAGTVLGSFIADDPEGDALSYWLQYFNNASDVNHFEVDASRQLVVANGADLSFESRLPDENGDKWIKVGVRAQDSKGLYGGVTVKVILTDVDEPPAFGRSAYSFSMSATTPPNTNLGTVFAADPEATDDNQRHSKDTSNLYATKHIAGQTVSYSLEGTHGTSFLVNSSTGAISTKPGVNYTAGTEYSLSAKATAGTLSSTAPITISTSSGPPVFAKDSMIRGVQEGLPVNSPVGNPVTATDPDDDPLTYTISGTDAAHFSVDATTGQMRTKSVFDRDTKDRYSVVITATDPAGHSDSVNLDIPIRHRNELPTFSNSSHTFNFSLSAATSVIQVNGASVSNPATHGERSITGVLIGNPITATDRENDRLTYSIVGVSPMRNLANSNDRRGVNDGSGTETTQPTPDASSFMIKSSQDSGLGVHGIGQIYGPTDGKILLTADHPSGKRYRYYNWAWQAGQVYQIKVQACQRTHECATTNVTINVTQ